MPASPQPDASFSLRAVETRLVGTRFAGRLKHFSSVGSTSTLALDAAQAGATGGVWIADEQTAGRGRGGHTWHSAAGDGLYVSALVIPKLLLKDALLLPLATGLAARAAIKEATGLEIDIRWPNDLMLKDGSGLVQKKTGGILVESASDTAPGEEPRLRYAVIGVGINVNHPAFPDELAGLATSLRIAAGHAYVREELLAALLRELDKELSGLDSGGDRVLERFAAASSWVAGKRVIVGEDGGYTGVTRGLDGRGFLQVLSDDGQLQTVLSGGVRPAPDGV